MAVACRFKTVRGGVGPGTRQALAVTGVHEFFQGSASCLAALRRNQLNMYVTENSLERCSPQHCAFSCTREAVEPLCAINLASAGGIS